MMNSKDKLIIPSKSKKAAELAGDIVFEILLRLPIKKAFQLSCVSKLWRSVILCPDFLKIYHSQNSYALVITVSNKENDFREINSVYHSILEQYDKSMDDTQPVEFINSLSKMNTDAIRITQPVHGLVCVCYNDSNNRRSLSLIRAHTGEIVMRLPDPGKHRLARYSLGFEPVNGVYKLLKIVKPIEYFCSQTIDSNCYDFEILTISRNITDMCWIKLPKSNVPVVFGPGRFQWWCHPYLDTQSFSFKGFLYWMLDQNLPFLISFDLREYKFRSIKPPHDNKINFDYCRLAQFRGQLALFKTEYNCLFIVIYTLDDDDGKDGDTCWTSHVIPLPSEVQQAFQPYGELIPVCNLPTGEILLAHVRTEDPFTLIYSYDYRKFASLQRFVVGKLPYCANNGFEAHICFDVDDGFCWI